MSLSESKLSPALSACFLCVDSVTNLQFGCTIMICKCQKACWAQSYAINYLLPVSKTNQCLRKKVDFFHLRQFLTKLGLFCSLDCSQGTYELLNNCFYSSLSDKIWTISLQFPSSSPFIKAAIMITPLFPEFVSDNSSKSLLTSLNILTIRLNLIYSLLFPNLSTVSIHLKNYMYYLPNQNSLIFQKMLRQNRISLLSLIFIAVLSPALLLLLQ